MSNIVRFDDFGDEIRVTEDGKFSVYDVIKFCTGSKNPSQYWNGDKSDRKTSQKRQKGFIERYPEVIRKTENFKFPGKGQRETPVAGRQGILYIIGLLPGDVGHALREEYVKVFTQYLDASPELAESVIDRATPEDLNRIQARLNGKKIRVSFTNTLYDHGVKEGWQIGACTNAIYNPLFGMDAKALKESRNLPAKATARDAMDHVELAAVSLAEALADRTITTENRQGFTQCRNACQNSAERVRRAVEG